jgi:hypothetical protein
MGSCNWKVALFTDHCLQHPSVELRNTELIFLPAYIHDKIHPPPQKKKKKFRRMLVCAIIR